MKILILANSDLGLYKFRKELIKTLVLEHKVFISLPWGEFVPEMIRLGCEYLQCEFDRHGKNPIYELKNYLYYKKIIKKIKPDIVLTYTIKPNIYGGFACAKLKIPYLVNITGLGTAVENGGFMQKFIIALYKMALRRAQQVFFQNEENLSFFIKKKIIKNNYQLIPGSGVNLFENCLEPYPQNNNVINFLFIGRIMKNKGVEEFFECAKYIRSHYPNTQFNVIGGIESNKYIQQIADLENQGVLKYYGVQKNVHEYIKNNHAIILPSYHEGLANVLLEAAACGRPIIATNVAGCRETFDDGISGLSCLPRSAQSLIESVENFIMLPYERKIEMGFAGRLKMEKEFDRKIVIKAYLQEINKVV